MLEQREEQTVMKPNFKTHFKVLYLLKAQTCETGNTSKPSETNEPIQSTL